MLKLPLRTQPYQIEEPDPTFTSPTTAALGATNTLGGIEGALSQRFIRVRCLETKNTEKKHQNMLMNASHVNMLRIKPIIRDQTGMKIVALKNNISIVIENYCSAPPGRKMNRELLDAHKLQCHLILRETSHF